MTITRTVICRVEVVREGVAVTYFNGSRVPLDVEVNLVADDTNSDGSMLQATIHVPPDQQPKIGERYHVSITPADKDAP